MTKRRCPWAIDINSQLKSHISVREVINGVDGFSYMNCIKEYTTNLLAKGAKSFYAESVTPMNEDVVDKKEQPYLNDQAQKTITSYFPSTSKTKTETSICSTDSSTCCTTCQHLPFSCDFCAKSLCDSCARWCYVCNQRFCVKCSFLRYDNNDSAVCYNCIT